MSEPVIELPPSWTFGKITGRLIHAIADTAEDADDRPQARAAAGRVRFTPRDTLRKATDVGATAIVTQGAQEAVLSSSGRVLDAEGRQGIWLVTGVWRVEFQLTSGGTVPAFDVEVTTGHTDAAPLDLATAAPFVAPTGTVVQTLLVPSGGTQGQALVRAADGSLVWGEVAGGGGSGDTTGLVTDDDLAAALDALGPADVGAQPVGDYATPEDVAAALAADLADVVRTTDARLSDARTPTAHTQAASTITDLTETVQDLVAAMVKPGSNLTSTYDDAAGTITVQVAGLTSAALADATTAGRALLTAADAAAQRTTLGVVQGGQFDPGPASAPPSTVPDGVTVGSVLAADGWPGTGTVLTVRRSPARVVQQWTGADADLVDVPDPRWRAGYVSAGVDGWGPWSSVPVTADALAEGLAGRTTPADVDARVQQVVGAAPAALDTLAEVAAALAEDDDALAALTTVVAAKADAADLATVATSGSYTDLTDRPAPGAAALGGDLAADEQVASWRILDDGSPTGSWPNRWQWVLNSAAGDRLVQWTNEYGELRLTPGRANTIPFRIFTRPAAADPAATGNMLEVARARDQRDLLFSVGPTGDVAANNVRGGIVSLPEGDPVPDGLPDGTVIVRH